MFNEQSNLGVWVRKAFQLLSGMLGLLLLCLPVYSQGSFGVFSEPS